MPVRRQTFYYEETSLDKLCDDDRILVQKAQGLLARRVPYSPYSRFLVGAALRCHSPGTSPIIVPGVNVENASYGLTICAERSAFVSALSQDIRRFKAMAVATATEQGPTAEASMSCGACRQYLVEMSQLSDNDISLLFSNTDGSKIIRITASALLHLGFGPADIGIDLQRYRAAQS